MKQTGKYGLPLEIKYCTRCTRSNQRPAVTQEYLQTEKKKKQFVEIEKDICGGCEFNYLKHNKINWKDREKEAEGTVQ